MCIRDSFRGGHPDDAVHTKQHDYQDDHAARRQILFHGVADYFFPSPDARLATALLATCSLILSGFTRNTSVSSSSDTIVPTIPPVVTTVVPFWSSANIFACCFFWRCMG